MALTRAQAIFSVALALVTVVISAFALYVVGSTVWGDRWMRRK